MGGQASWLLPAALLALVAGLAWRFRAPRTDRARAAVLLWGSWLVVSGLVFSLSGGVIHTYYTVALAPAIAALVAIGAAVAWRLREQFAARSLLALGVIATAAWAIVLLGRTPSWEPWLVPVIGVAAGVAAIGLLMPARVVRRLSAATAVIALVACLAGPVAYSAQTINSAHTGSVPSAGPSVSGGSGGFGGFGGGAARGGAGGGAGAVDSGVDSALVAALKSGASGYRWAAATSGSQSAATLELASGGVPVMAIGGFSGAGREPLPRAVRGLRQGGRHPLLHRVRERRRRGRSPIGLGDRTREPRQANRRGVGRVESHAWRLHGGSRRALCRRRRKAWRIGWLCRTSRRVRRWRRWARRQFHHERDHQLGQGALPRRDHRRPDRLQPDSTAAVVAALPVVGRSCR